MDHFGRVERLTKPTPALKRRHEAIALAAIHRRRLKNGSRRWRIGEENERGDANHFDCPMPAASVGHRSHRWHQQFHRRLRAFCVCIGLLERGEPVLGVVLDVCQDLAMRPARAKAPG